MFLDQEIQETEIKLKQLHAQRALQLDAMQQAGGCNEASTLSNQCSCPPSTLRDRVRGKLNMIECERGTVGAIQELNRLLDQHPDTARILELLEQIGHKL